MTDPTAAEKRALDELFGRLYDRIRQLAARVRWHGANPTLNPTALAHEAYLRLLKSPWNPGAESSEAAIGVFANAMREILIDASRRKNAQKRVPAPAAEADALAVEDVLTLDALVESMRRENPRQARIVDCRFYLGMTVEETGAVLGLSSSTVEREWRKAKGLLNEKLKRNGVEQ